jgi:hypothetical protein
MAKSGNPEGDRPLGRPRYRWEYDRNKSEGNAV